MADANTIKCNVGFIGLGAMGSNMVSHLLKLPEYSVKAYDVYQPSLQAFASKGGATAASAKELAKHSEVLVFMVVSDTQVRELLFGGNGMVQELHKAAILTICSTVGYTFYAELERRLNEVGRSDFQILDCPVSGGTKGATNGTLSIMASGPEAALAKSKEVLEAMSAKLYLLPGGAGTGSKIKMVNQLMVGCHIAAAAETMALVEQMGLDTRKFYESVVGSAANSWAFEDRVPHMLKRDWTPLSAANIFVKDMSIVVSTAQELGFPLPISGAAEQMYRLAAVQGYGKEDDAGVVRVFLPRHGKNSNQSVQRKVKTGESPESESSSELLVQFLVVMHTLTAIEALAFARRLGLDTQLIFDILSNAAASSNALRERGPLMLKDELQEQASYGKCIETLRAVLAKARELVAFCPIASAAYTWCLAMDDAGFANGSDAQFIESWASIYS